MTRLSSFLSPKSGMIPQLSATRPRTSPVRSPPSPPLSWVATRFHRCGHLPRRSYSWMRMFGLPPSSLPALSTTTATLRKCGLRCRTTVTRGMQEAFEGISHHYPLQRAALIARSVFNLADGVPQFDEQPSSDDVAAHHLSAQLRACLPQADGAITGAWCSATSAALVAASQEDAEAFLARLPSNHLYELEVVMFSALNIDRARQQPAQPPLPLPQDDIDDDFRVQRSASLLQLLRPQNRPQRQEEPAGPQFQPQQVASVPTASSGSTATAAAAASGSAGKTAACHSDSCSRHPSGSSAAAHRRGATGPCA